MPHFYTKMSMFATLNIDLIKTFLNLKGKSSWGVLFKFDYLKIKFQE